MTHADDIVRYGVIGTGMMGIEHIENVNVLEGGVVTAIADTHAASRDAGAAAAGSDVAVFDDHRDLLGSGLCDAVVVASPNHTHADIAADLLETDLHALLEKPLTTGVDDCERLIALDAERSAHAITWMAMEYRYMSVTAELVRQVRAGVVGAPRMVAIREHRYPFLAKVENWNRFTEKTGGTLVEKTCHFFDLMNLILTERPHRVFASGAQDVNHLDEIYDGRAADMLDNAYVVVDYPSGARALLDLCMFADATQEEQETSVVGATGKVEAFIPSNTLRVGRRGVHGLGGVEQRQVADDRIAYQGLHHGSSYIEHLHFIEAIRTGAAPEVTLDDGYWAVAMGVAAHRSIDLGRPVELAEIMSADMMNPYPTDTADAAMNGAST
ncbi:MAG: Gfo/Idh/MocA family oxidoreductase [Ilumatobacter sp.]|uniref:Gfo/Idh/MocA family protein n=1 Tax=Ilumatobacter sp. TaxID=1967498 RepID=UPI002613D322|nr:Gfo/Idh/MocA family oxidoreductase [Ilumatobacter sp.]MDJ0767857.1 Gfo/Idh/MocA family oxidoreductase [Ilumatobacter sp.]